METFIKILGASLLLIGVLFIVALVIGLPIMLLWNWLMPVIFGLPTLTFCQAVGAAILANLLFKANINLKDK